jgi:hypothetical protein
VLSDTSTIKTFWDLYIGTAPYHVEA